MTRENRGFNEGLSRDKVRTKLTKVFICLQVTRHPVLAGLGTAQPKLEYFRRCRWSGYIEGLSRDKVHTGANRTTQRLTQASTRCNEMLCSPQVCVGNERAYEFLPWGRDGQAITQDGCQAVVAVDGQGLCSKRLATVNLTEIEGVVVTPHRPTIKRLWSTKDCQKVEL